MRTWNLSLRIRDLEQLVRAQGETVREQARREARLQQSRDEWRILAEGWAQMCDELQGERNKLDQKVGQYESGARTEKEYQAVVKECDDLQTVLRYGSNEYKVERDKALKRVAELERAAASAAFQLPFKSRLRDLLLEALSA